MTWQPIETAPKDGSFIIYGPSIGVICEVENWLDTQFACFFSESYGRIYNPTHWMPLPEPPA